MRVFILALAAATLSGCGGLSSVSLLSSKMYVRADGQPVAQQLMDADLESCTASGDAQRCMVAKGYFYVDSSKADAKRTELAQISEANRQREETRLAAERKQQEDLERARRREAAKKKKKVQTSKVN